MKDTTLELCALVDTNDDPADAIQYAVAYDGKTEIFGDQPWVRSGEAAGELEGVTLRRTITISYGEWEQV